MPETPATPNTGKPETGQSAKPTTYVVLRQRTGTDHWEEAGRASGAPEGAIRVIAAKRDGDVATPDGTYVAVPARSWRPVTVQAVQTTVLKIEDAT